MLATSMETPAMQRAGPSPAVSTPYEQEVVLLTTVDIAPGYSQVIKMRRTDSAYSVAQEFCRAHGLPEAVVGALEDHLQSHLDKAQVRFSRGFLKIPPHNSTCKTKWCQM